jgi:serine/threonine protein kinase
MKYLGEMKIIHRDLAARNVLAAPGDNKHRIIVKIGDFGLSRATETYSSTSKIIPIKWSPPEVIQRGEWSFQSDVCESLLKVSPLTLLFRGIWHHHVGSVDLWKYSL